MSDSTTATAIENLANATSALQQPLQTHWSASDILMPAGILCAFTLVFFLVVSFVVVKSGEGLSDRYFKLTAVILIVSLASFLTVAGYSADQSNAALGLLGTVAGYLLGKGDSKKKNSGEDSDA